MYSYSYFVFKFMCVVNTRSCLNNKTIKYSFNDGYTIRKEKDNERSVRFVCLAHVILPFRNLLGPYSKPNKNKCFDITIENHQAATQLFAVTMASRNFTMPVI